MEKQNIIPANTPIISQPRPDKKEVKKLDAVKKQALHECIIILKGK